MKTGIRLGACVVLLLASSACGSDSQVSEGPEESTFGSPCRPYNSVHDCRVGVLAVIAQATGGNSNSSVTLNNAYDEWRAECNLDGDMMVGDLDPVCVDILDRIAAKAIDLDPDIAR